MPQQHKVYAEDMTDERMNFAIETAKEAFLLSAQSEFKGDSQNTKIAKHVRTVFDAQHGR